MTSVFENVRIQSNYIHTAVTQGKLELVEEILDRTYFGQKYLNTLLHIAVSYGQVAIARLMITKYKCPVDCRNGKKQTPLHIACSKGHVDVVRMLVSEQKADYNARDQDNETPLHEAAWYGKTEVIMCLINEFGCSPNVKGVRGRTILHYACRQWHSYSVNNDIA